ncbi:hypothetical protein HLB44_02390 [Aquincola sp. S2]|uniref:Uncharacterized protein n=1 Tax=Pseudaquabacterium terrae TaxID=2732868 RepID=A0ABX2EAH5_9BURK|nr:hypothetical protein [Aquabacterium terrae]NRF65828.1 hypothetical protein [Aquabacterium terrae]
MAVLRIELDVDSEVYPELHALLAAIGSEASRGERLRQLAATGLVWEVVRIRGYPASLVARAATEPLPAAEPAEVAKAAVPRRATVRRAAAPTAPAAPFTPPAPGAPGSADFVDLALNAVPPPAPEPWPGVVHEPPVLNDVVEPDPAGPTITVLPDPPLEHRTSTRSRLQRMKEKGLFRNG